MLLLLDPGVQRRGRIAIQNRHHLLKDDGPCIGACIDKMNRATRHLGPVIQRLFPGFHSREGRQQGRMNIDNPVRKPGKKPGLDDSHETGQRHHVRAIPPQGVEITLFTLALKLGFERGGTDEFRGNPLG